MQSPGKPIEISFQTAWQVSAKKDPYRFPTLCKATILQINNRVWGQMSCYIRAVKFYAVWPFVDRNPFKHKSWMQVIDFFFSQLRDISQNVSYVSYIIICTMCHHKSMLLPKLYLRPIAQNLPVVHAWWQFPLHLVEGRWCAWTEAAEKLLKTFQHVVGMLSTMSSRQQCKNPNPISAFDFLLWPWLSICVPAFPPVQDPRSWGSCEDYLL